MQRTMARADHSAQCARKIKYFTVKDGQIGLRWRLAEATRSNVRYMTDEVFVYYWNGGGICNVFINITNLSMRTICFRFDFIEICPIDDPV